MWPTWRENPLFSALLSLVLLGLIVFLGGKAYQTFLLANRVDQPTPMERTIYIEGIGKESMVPDVAVMTFGIDVTADSVANAQKQNTDKMNQLIEKIKGLGVAKEDVQTKDYSAFEKTEWDYHENKSVSKGWTVSQKLEVKVRDQNKLSTIISTAGQGGTSFISGPVFRVDEPAAYEAKARTKALADADQKMRAVASSLGMKVEKVIGYSEYKEDNSNPYGYGMGGVGGAMSEKGAGAPTPTIESGTQEIKLHASVTYLISR